MRRRVGAGLLGLAFWAIGACGDGGGSSGPEPELQLVAPAANDVFGPEDDTSPLIDGVQIEVTLATTAFPVGARVVAVSSGAPLSPQAQTVLTPDGIVRFDAVTLSEGTNEISVSADLGADHLADATVTVTLVVPPPAPALRIDAPRNRSTLAPDADRSDEPGYQTNVVASATGIADGVSVNLDVQGELATQAEVTSGTVRFGELTLPPGSVELRAWVVIDERTIEAISTVTVDVGTCEVSISPSPRGRCDVTVAGGDVDTDTPGFQAVVTVVSDCEDRRLRVDGEPIAAVETRDGETDFWVTVESGTFSAVGVASEGDRSGESAAAVFGVSVDELEIMLEPPGAIGATTDESRTQPGLQRTMRGTAVAPDGARVLVTVDGAPAGQGTVREGAWTSSALTFVQSGEVIIAASVEDGCGQAASDQQTVAVTLSGDDLVLEAPVDGFVVGPATDEDASTPGVQTTAVVRGGDGIEGTASVECKAAGARSFVRVGSAPTAEGGVTFPITPPEGVSTCRPRIDGDLVVIGAESTVEVDVEPLTLRIIQPRPLTITNAATIGLAVAFEGLRSGEAATTEWWFAGGERHRVVDTEPTFAQIVALPEGAGLLEFDVTDGYGNTAHTQIGLEIDRTAPVLVPTSPRAGGVVRRSAIQLTADGPRMTATLLASGAIGGSVCISVNAGSLRCASPATDGAVTIENVTIGVGSNTFAASATDVAGNVTVVTGSFTAEINVPSVRFVSPTDGTLRDSTAPLDVEIDTDVAAGIDVELELDGSVIGVERANADGDARFVGVTLPFGRHTLTAVTTDPRGRGAASISIAVDPTTPELVLTSPADGEVFASGTPDAAPDVEGLQLLVVASTGGLLDETPTGVELECDEVASSQSAAVRDGRVSALVTVPAEAHCLVALRARNLINVEASDSAAFVVDTIAPSVAWLAPLDGAVVRTDEDTTTPLVQLRPAVRVAGAGVGEAPRFRIGAGGAVVGAALTATDSDLTGPTLTIPDGHTTLGVIVSDAVGNLGEAVISVVGASAAAGAVIDSPVSGTTLAATADEDTSASGVQATIRGTISGDYTGDDARLCVRSSDAVRYPTACGTLGWRQVAVQTIASPSVRFDLVTLPDGALELGIEVGIGAVAIAPRAVAALIVDGVGPRLTRLSVPTDANGDGVLSRAETTAAGAVGRAQVRAELSGLESSQPVRFFDNGALVGSAVAAGGVATLTLTLADGPHRFTVDAVDVAGNPMQSSTLAATVTVDVTPPTLRITRPASGSILAASADLDAGTSGLQTRVEVASDAPNGTSVVLSATGAGGSRSLGVATLSAGVGSVQVTLVDGESTITAVADDAAGNRATATCSVTVDVTPPTAPVLSVAATGPRSTQSNVRWTPTSGVTRVEVRTSLSPIDATNFGTATLVLDRSLPFTLTSGAVQAALPATPLTALRYVSGRVFDAAGNTSTIGSVVLEAALSSEEVLAGVASGSRVAAVGDLDADGIDDLAVYAASGSLAVVYGGAASFETATLSAPGGASDWGTVVFGCGDVNGDGADDLAVGAPGSGAGGAVYLYFGDPLGGHGLGSSPDVILTASSGAVGTVATSGRGDLVDTPLEGSSYDDLVLGDPTDSGVVYVVAGRGVWPATLTLPASAGLGLGVDAVRVDGSTAGLGFGAAVAVAGDIDGDGLSEVVASTLDGQLTYWLGRDVAALDGLTDVDAESEFALPAVAATLEALGLFDPDDAPDVGVWLGSSGGFAVYTGADPLPSVAEVTIHPTLSAPRAAWAAMWAGGAGDADLSGRSDVWALFSDSAGTCTVGLALSSASGAFDTPAQVVYEGACPTEVASGDFNGDGMVDVGFVGTGAGVGTALSILY
ncbi:MAG: FG-GAP repeat protein [Myxococcales bacterium]|nr:FG-GAP repeat protein [Myxococcales bacterium]MCB9530231.1 FG-GAP repeat protein [Myxococcales bacterium]